MGVKEVKEFFQERNLDFQVQEFTESTATVELAARALGVEPGMIAKTMSFKVKDNGSLLLIAAGDKRVDNRKFKDTFKGKGSMLSPDEVSELTGHPVGGVCPFALKHKLPVYLDVSLQAYQYIYPAAGSPNSAVKMTPADLEQVTGGSWVDVCK
ncbi:MAG TPA: YbaK/EbsC family protein [Peptococcaceae bacterium]|nr:YbaK/EbsC family protein [Peptococcaceae bacterium]